METERNREDNTTLKLIFWAILAFSLVGLWFQFDLLSAKNKHLPPLSSRMAHSRRLGDLCQLPSINAFHEDFLAFETRKAKLDALDCIQKTNHSKRLFRGKAFKMENGSYLRKLADVGTTCCWNQFQIREENNDELILPKPCHAIENELTKIPEDIEFITVMCLEDSTADVLYVQPFPVVHKKINGKSKPTLSGGRHLNVIMIGMDSSSQLNFYRTMPFTHQYLKRNLSAIFLKGYNAVAECTYSNFIPLVTGQTAHRFRETCVQPQMAKGAPVKLDNCPLLWNKFEDKGYITSFSEDYFDWGPLHYFYPKPFRKQPTHYYFRPMAVLHSHLSQYYRQDYLCIGSSSSFEILMDYLKTITDVNRERPFFQFIFSGGLGYNGMSEQARGDEELLSTLKHLKDTNVLNSSVVFIFGDHGYRKRGYVFTKYGGIELRMPIGIFVFPEWFPKLYPEHFSNLKSNSEITTSHFDIHKTLLDILNLKKENVGSMKETVETQKSSYFDLGTSLFKRIPDKRTCLSAGIPLMWCNTCYNKVPLPESDAGLKTEIAEFLIGMLKTKRNQTCHPNAFPKGLNLYLGVLEILSTSEWNLYDVRRQLCSTSGGIILPGYFGQPSITLNISCTLPVSQLEVRIIQVEIKIEYLDATFSCEVIRYKENGKWNFHLTEDIQYNWLN